MGPDRQSPTVLSAGLSAGHRLWMLARAWTAGPSSCGCRDDRGQPRFRVVVADDQRMVREGLVTLLGVLPDIEVVGAASNGEEAVALVERHRPQVALMDLRMPRLDGVEATRRILSAHPDTRIVVLTTYADDDSILAASRAGALGLS